MISYLSLEYNTEHDSRIAQLIAILILEMMIAATAWILIFALALFHRGSALILDPDCGYLTPGDSEADLSLRPWMAQIVTDSKMCSGVLVNNQHVLTAASCVVNKTSALVRLGNFNNDHPDPKMHEDYYVQTATIHILYNETTYSNDIALLKLQRKVGYKQHIRPICLSLNKHTIDSASTINTFTATLLGLGREPLFRNPITVLMHRFHPNQCHDIFQNSQICAQTKTATSCVETGSPLGKNQNVMGGLRYSLFGIQSYGNTAACVYTNVMSYFDWIVRNILDVDIVSPITKKSQIN